ncbi:MAG: monovalent cation/H(+) antiporter subunit G [Alphaproteobacteria bacterium]|nr:monovalent cation/H(+) antiporter subunit G [Alphaproteobacteria bacterium]
MSATAIMQAIGMTSLIIGSLAVIFGALGLLRLGDVYQRMHGTGIVDTGGAGLILFGLIMVSPDWTVTVRLVLIGFILVMTGPTATHAIARAVRVSGEEPENVKPKKAKRAKSKNKARGKGGRK